MKKRNLLMLLVAAGFAGLCIVPCARAADDDDPDDMEANQMTAVKGNRFFVRIALPRNHDPIELAFKSFRITAVTDPATDTPTFKLKKLINKAEGGGASAEVKHRTETLNAIPSGKRRITVAVTPLSLLDDPSSPAPGNILFVVYKKGTTDILGSTIIAVSSTGGVTSREADVALDDGIKAPVRSPIGVGRH